MARSVDADASFKTALPPATGRVSAVRGSGGGLPLGRAVGARDYGFVQRGGRAGTRVELAGHGPPLRAELEERGYDSETGSGLRPASPETPAGACDRNRRSEPPEGPGVSHGGLRSGTAGPAVGRRRPDRRHGEAVFHQGNGPAALPDPAGGVHGYVGDVRQVGKGTRAQREDPV